MASEIARPRVYGNFRPDRFASVAAPQKWRSQRVGMSPEHLTLLRQLQCTVCEAKRLIHAHHLTSGPAAKERGISLKATDRWAIPVCAGHHDEIHRFGSRKEPAWFWDNFGINPHALADALWQNSGDLARMNRVLLAHKLAASKELLSRKAKR